MLRSDEFIGRYTQLCPSGGVVPVDSQFCELANPAKWDNPAWMAIYSELKLNSPDKLNMHRKGYEFTQTAWVMNRLGLLTDATSVLSVGAGHESLVFWLANHVGSVVATDLYEGRWGVAGAAEGDARVVFHPGEFAPFDYRRDRLKFLPMDGRSLAFRSESFDVAYSLSSIEHFGGWSAAREAVEEMCRVVRPGGVVLVATEWILEGPKIEEAFLPAEIHRLFAIENMTQIQATDERVWDRYEASVIDIQRNPYELLHMKVRIGDTVFTSVFVALRKTGS